MVRLNTTFYLIIIGCDCGVYMLIRMVLLSNGFETKNYDQRHADTRLKMLVLYISDHQCSLISKELCEHNEEENRYDVEVFIVRSKNHLSKINTRVAMMQLSYLKKASRMC